MEYVAPSDVDEARSKKRWAMVIGIGIVIVLLFVISGILFAKSRQSPKPQIYKVEQPPGQQQTISSVQGKYLFNGTVVIARAVEKYAQGDYNQPFSQLDTFNRNAYDGWSTDFECPITNNVVPYDLQISNLVFNCRPEFLPGLTKYFNIFDLANNHTDNQGGQEGIASTRKYLQEAGVQFFGNYDPTILKDICEVIALPVRIQKQDKTEQKASLPIAFCGWHYFNYNRGPTEAELAVAKKYAAVMPVFAFAEIGNEYQASASEEQRTIAKQIIDTGAEFVLANNPHWVQDSEVYKGKLIVYSLGNFIFDQIDAETQRGVSIDTLITIPYDDNVAKWLALGNSCQAFKDSCLEQARQQGLKKVNIKLFYTPVANQNGARKVTHKATPEEQKAVEERLNWAVVSKDLGQ
jgi:poly-gamma-glutamate synthesis protein (capsule biosynthesis protein)